MVGETQERRLPFDGVLAEVFRDVVDATRAEAGASIRNADDAIELLDGHNVGVSGAESLWSFAVERDMAPMPETPGLLVVGDSSPLPARVLSVGDGTLVIAVADDLGDRVDRAVLSLNAGFVLERLEERLEHLILDDEADATLVDALLNPDPAEEVDGIVPLLDPGPDGEQRQAAVNAVADGLRFTWGPPGTGKTRVLAMAVAETVVRGDRVLVVSHANAAVDVAMAAVAVEMADDPVMASGGVLRIGPPHLPVLDDSSMVVPEFHLAERWPDLIECRERLRRERRAQSDLMRRAVAEEHQRLAGELQSIRRELRQVETQLDERRREMIGEASVIGTTLAKLVVDSDLWAWTADAVLVDEASMVGIPFALALAARRPRTLSFFGDFRQLPPIAVGRSNEVRRWFGRDVFEVSGIVKAHEAGEADRRVQMLHTQFRMGEQICETINPFAYGGLLATDHGARNRAIGLAERWPELGSEVVVVDTGGLGGECSVEVAADAFSRFSLASMAASVAVAESVAAEVSVEVGLISPYRAQVQLMAAAVGRHPRITAATIHRFQGSERDVVVLDLTDGPDRSGPSRLTGSDADLSLRLLNVAASRARGKLIVLADLDWMEEAHPLGSTGRRLVSAAEDAGAVFVEAWDLLAAAPVYPDESPIDPSVHWYGSWGEAVESIESDMAGGADIDLHVPEVSHAGPWLSPLLNSADSAVLRAGFRVASTIGDTSADVSLRTVGRIPWAITDESSMIVGGRSEDDPAALIRSPRLVRAYRRLIDLPRWGVHGLSDS